MSTNTSSRLRTASLFLTVLITLAACSQKENNQVENTANDPKTDEATSTATDVITDKYPTPVEFTIGAMTNAGVTNWEKGDTPDNNAWTREFEKLYNIKVKNSWSAEMSQYANKVNVSIASGDVPDAFLVNNTQFIQAVKAGLVADLTDAYEKYASPLLKASMEADPIGFESGKVDGKLMGISTQHYGLISGLHTVWIRDDWMKKLNLAPPKTMDDLIKILEAFTFDDPDGNGKNDTFGLSITNGLYNSGISDLSGFFNAYRAYPAIWIKDASGQIVYGSVQPEMKKALAVLQDLYKKGVISKEFAVKDVIKANEDLINNKVGVEFGACWNGQWPGPDIMKKNGTDAILMPYAIPSADENPIKLGVNWPINQYAVVSKKSKNPEAYIKMANLYSEMNNNATPEQYNTFIKNEAFAAFVSSIQDPNSDYEQYVAISDALKTGDESKLKPSQRGKYDLVMKWLNEKDPDASGYYTQVSDAGAYAYTKKLIDEGNYILTEYRGIDTPTMVKKSSTLNSMINETLTKIIMGASLDEFDKMVEKWKSLGGDTMTQEMNDTYNKQ